MTNKLVSALPLLLVVGCGATVDQLRDRAAYDLQCGRENLQITEIDARTRGVVGCGQRVTYVESCNGMKGQATTQCSWVLNSDSTPAEPAASAAPAAPPAPQPLCVPNETKACLGPGACNGAQACLPNGSGYSPCDCGT